MTRCNFLVTLVRMISWGKLVMALVSQVSRLLAKLRMAWVRVPEGTEHSGLQTERNQPSPSLTPHDFCINTSLHAMAGLQLIKLRMFTRTLCSASVCLPVGFMFVRLNKDCSRMTCIMNSTYWEQDAAHQGWGSPPEPGTGCGRSSSSTVWLVHIYTEPAASLWGSHRPGHRHCTQKRKVKHLKRWLAVKIENCIELGKKSHLI